MKVLITPRGFANNGKKFVEKMEEAGIEVDYNTTGKQYSYETFVEKLKTVDAAIVGVDRVDAAAMEQAHNLKAVCKFGVGIDNIDVEYTNSHNISVGRTVGSNSNAVAEHVIAFMFADAKNLISNVNEVKTGSWNKPTGFELEGKTLGIVGFGAIGKILGEKTAHLGMKVQVFDIFNIKDEDLAAANAKQVEFEELIKTSDFVSLHLPLNDKTKDTISDHELSLMKKSACLINAARGGIVNEEALTKALEKGTIRSAYFDVMEEEPPKDSNLLAESHFYLTAHTAARTTEADVKTCQFSTEFIMKTLGVI